MRFFFRLAFTCCSVVMLLGVAEAQAKKNDAEHSGTLQTVLNRYREILLKQPCETDAHLLDQYLATLSPAGTWPDVDYAEAAAAGWPPEKHLFRTRNLARNYVEPGTKYYKQPAVLEAIHRAIDSWNKHRYQAPNWWHNEIGVPRTMRDIVILLGEEIEGKRFDEAVETINQHQLRGTAANLMWSAELAAHHACLTKKPHLAAHATQRIWDEIKIHRRAGIQEDWSFFQHKTRLHTFSYGGAYINIAIKMSWQMRETPWAIPPEKQAILSSYLTEGVQWMSRGTHTVPSTIDRAFSRKGRLHWADMRQLLTYWLDVDQGSRKPIEQFLARQNGESLPLVGHRHFQVADFTTYHRPSGSIFLKTLSTRTWPTEMANNENLKGQPFLHSGDHYIMQDGLEIEGLQPVLKWKRLPGITIANVKSKQHRREFVGGISNGTSGLTAMDYCRTLKKEQEFSVRKSWFFHNDTMICLLGGWEVSDRMKPIVTSLEQCHHREPVSMANASGNVTKLPVEESKQTKEKLSWVLHRGVGYLPLGEKQIDCTTGIAEGTWASINSKYRHETTLIREQVVQISMQHGTTPEPTGYAVLLDATKEKLAALSKEPTWTVLKNNRSCQAIQFDDGLTMATFFEPASIETQSGKLTVDQPCLAMWSTNSLMLCDPTHEGIRVNVHWNGKLQEVKLPAGGVTKEFAEFL